MSEMPEWAVEPEKKQGGDAWHAWRAQGLGGSDAPIVMGVSPWKTPYQLWQIKTGKIKDKFEGNWATERGHKLEPIIRKKVEQKLSKLFPDETFANGIFLASMDGWCKSANEGLEIKAPNIGDHMTAQEGKVPEKYKWQLVHQFIATGAKQIWYASFYVTKEELEAVYQGDETKGDLRIVPVTRSKPLIDEYIKKANEFWQYVLTDNHPPYTDKDTVEIEGTQLAVLATKYKQQLEEQQLANARVEHTKSEIIEIVRGKGHKKVVCNGLSVTEVNGRHGLYFKLEVKAGK